MWALRLPFNRHVRERILQRHQVEPVDPKQHDVRRHAALGERSVDDRCWLRGDMRQARHRRLVDPAGFEDRRDIILGRGFLKRQEPMRVTPNAAIGVIRRVGGKGVGRSVNPEDTTSRHLTCPPMLVGGRIARFDTGCRWCLTRRVEGDRHRGCEWLQRGNRRSLSERQSRIGVWSVSVMPEVLSPSPLDL